MHFCENILCWQKKTPLVEWVDMVRFKGHDIWFIQPAWIFFNKFGVFTYADLNAVLVHMPGWSLKQLTKSRSYSLNFEPHMLLLVADF